tara:strand:+ start:268 stop:474 length:207 start_codon:yes stop_codon:yes gene_type:complete
MGNMVASHCKINEDLNQNFLQIERQKSRELIFKGKPDPIAMAISKALDDPETSPLSIKNRKSFEEKIK